jgi:hypothetical protein
MLACSVGSCVYGGVLLMSTALISLTTKAGCRDKKFWRIARWSLAALILLLPLLAMQFTTEVAWDFADFMIFGALLAGAGGAYELAMRVSGHRAYRAAIAVALAAAFILIWVNLAVGIIGDEGNPANLMYVGVLAVGIIGASITRGQPRGMARTLSVMAFAQGLVPVIALLFLKIAPISGPAGLIFFDVNSFFVMQLFCSLLRPALMRTLPVLAPASYAQGAVVDPALVRQIKLAGDCSSDALGATDDGQEKFRLGVASRLVGNLSLFVLLTGLVMPCSPVSSSQGQQMALLGGA